MEKCHVGMEKPKSWDSCYWNQNHVWNILLEIVWNPKKFPEEWSAYICVLFFGVMDVAKPFGRFTNLTWEDLWPGMESPIVSTDGPGLSSSLRVMTCENFHLERCFQKSYPFHFPAMKQWRIHWVQLNVGGMSSNVEQKVVCGMAETYLPLWWVGVLDGEGPTSGE